MGKPVVLDIETKKTLQEVGGKNADKLGISVAGLYSYESDQYYTFMEQELDKLFRILEHSSTIVGFNINSFDLPVLRPYYIGQVAQFATFDMMDEVKNALGRRLALNDLAGATLNVKKSGHGLTAVNYFNEGKWDELKRYCLDDVRITRDLFEYGKKHGEIYFAGSYGKQTIRVNWQHVGSSFNARDTINLTLPI